MNDEKRGSGARWSHQHELNQAVRKGRKIVCTYKSGVALNGTLIAADQFTLKVRVDSLKNMDGQLVEGLQQELVIYKHALAAHSFC